MQATTSTETPPLLSPTAILLEDRELLKQGALRDYGASSCEGD